LLPGSRGTEDSENNLGLLPDFIRFDGDQGIEHRSLGNPRRYPLTLNWVISTSPDGTGTVDGDESGISLSTSFLKTIDGGGYDLY
jgi:hypothetical protein